VARHWLGSLLGLAGAMVTIPVLGLAAGAGLGALGKAAQEMGIFEEQLVTIRRELTPGSSRSSW
jgi:uncharacterized membrane protein